jgi:hypothetical protein
MPISTQTEALLDLYNQKISLDQKQLEQVTTVQTGYTITTGIGASDYIKVWGPEEVIENYNYPIEKLDNRIVELNTQIANLKTQILTIGQNASTAGCGTTAAPFVSVASSTVNCKVYSLSGTNPFAESTQTLSSSNLGIGVSNSIITVSIGTYHADLSTCNEINCSGAPGGSCVAAAASITTLSNQIGPLVTERDDLIVKVNFLKDARLQYELQNYAYNQSKSQINTSIGISSSIISFLEDPNNEEWL